MLSLVTTSVLFWIDSLVPTFDFKQEILSHGADYEVLCPDWFRDEIKAEVVKMCEIYGI